MIAKHDDGVILIYHVFVPWSQILPGTDDDAYIRMSHDTTIDHVAEGNYEGLELVGGIVVGREGPRLKDGSGWVFLTKEQKDALDTNVVTRNVS